MRAGGGGGGRALMASVPARLCRHHCLPTPPPLSTRPPFAPRPLAPRPCPVLPGPAVPRALPWSGPPATGVRRTDASDGPMLTDPSDARIRRSPTELRKIGGPSDPRDGQGRRGRIRRRLGPQPRTAGGSQGPAISGSIPIEQLLRHRFRAAADGAHATRDDE